MIVSCNSKCRKDHKSYSVGQGTLAGRNRMLLGKISTLTCARYVGHNVTKRDIWKPAGTKQTNEQDSRERIIIDGN